MKEDIKSFQPKVKASKSVKCSRDTAILKSPSFFPYILVPKAKVRSRLSTAAQPPVTKFRDNTACQTKLHQVTFASYMYTHGDDGNCKGRVGYSFGASMAFDKMF